MSESMQPFLNALTETVLDVVSEATREHDLSDEDIDGLIKRSVSLSHQNFLEVLKAHAPAMLAELRGTHEGFRKRCYERWREPMDLLWMLWVISQEVGEAHAHEGPKESDPLVFDTLAYLHLRALLITSEVLCLLEGGFADGALTRWRSLHEAVVTAMFIAKHGHIVARDYRASIWFQDHKAASALNAVAERAEIEPLSDEELREIEAARDRAAVYIGRRLKGDWDWAATALPDRPIRFINLARARRGHGSLASPLQVGVAACAFRVSTSR